MPTDKIIDNFQVKLKLLDIASMVIQNGYTPQNKGLYDDMANVRTTRTPENIAAVYEELLEKFKVF